MTDRRSLRALNRATLARQGLIERMTGPVADVAGRLAGLQAQHANAPYVALWSRRDGQTIADLEAALADRSVVRATVMRSTLHLVAAADFAVLDTASALPRVAVWQASARGRRRGPDRAPRGDPRVLCRATVRGGDRGAPGDGGPIARARRGPGGRPQRSIPDGERVRRPRPRSAERALARARQAWDSVLIGYDVRDRILPAAVREAVIKKNGTSCRRSSSTGSSRACGRWR